MKQNWQTTDTCFLDLVAILFLLKLHPNINNINNITLMICNDKRQVFKNKIPHMMK